MVTQVEARGKKRLAAIALVQAVAAEGRLLSRDAVDSCGLDAAEHEMCADHRVRD